MRCLFFFIGVCFFSGCSEKNISFSDCNQKSYPGAPETDWFFSYGGSGEEAHGHYVLELSDGGFLQVGETLFSKTNKKILVVKTNANGSLVWKKEYTSGGNSFGNSAFEIDDGYLVCGKENDDSLIFKLNKDNGEIVFKKTFDGGGSDSFEHLVVVNDRIYAAGYINSTDPYNSFYSEGQGHIMVLTIQGELVKKVDLSAYVSQAYRIAHSGEYLYVSGLNHGAEDYVLIKMDFNQSVLWKYDYGGENQDHCFGMDVSGSGDIFLTGHTLSGTENWDTYTLKVSADGKKLWDTKIGNPRGFNPKYIHDEAWGVVSLNDGGCVVVAGTGDEYDQYSNTCEYSGESSDRWKVYLIRLDAFGGLVWERTFGVDTEDWAGEDVKITRDEGIIVGVDNGGFGFLKLSHY